MVQNSGKLLKTLMLVKIGRTKSQEYKSLQSGEFFPVSNEAWNLSRYWVPINYAEIKLEIIRTNKIAQPPVMAINRLG